MKTIYYIPKTPQSVPLVDKEKGIASVMFDGELIDIPLPLFEKIFASVEQELAPSAQQSNDEAFVAEMKPSINILKQIGLTKEALTATMDELLRATNMEDAKSISDKLLDDLFED